MEQLIHRIRGELPGAFWYIWLGTLINRLGSFVVPFMAIYLTDSRHLRVETAGMVLAMHGLGSLIGGPIAGWLSDRVGRRFTMLLSLFLGGTGVMLLGLAEGAMALAVGMLGFGFVTSLYRPAMGAAVADLVAPHLRSRAYGWIYWASNLGFAGASVLAGLLVKQGFWLLFVLDGLTMLLFGALIWGKVPETRPEPQAQAIEERSGLPYGDLLFMGVVLLNLLVATVFSQNIGTLPIAMRQDGISPAEYGLLMGINGLMIVIMQPWAAKLSSRFRPAHAMALASLLMGAGFGLNLWADGAFGYVTALVVWTLGEILMIPVGSTLVADLSPVDRRGAYQGAYASSWAIANVTAPLVGGWVLAHQGPVALWGGCLAFGVLAATGYLLVASGVEQRVSRLQNVTGPA